MPSQVKCNRSKSSLGEIFPNVNITPGMFADAMNNDHGCELPQSLGPTCGKKAQRPSSTVTVSVESHGSNRHRALRLGNPLTRHLDLQELSVAARLLRLQVCLP